MLPFKLVYSDALLPSDRRARLPRRKIPAHSRPADCDGVAEAGDFLEPQPATDQDILLVHTPEYVHKLKTGTLSPREEMEMEVPYSPELVKAFWLAAGGSILAARQALTDRVASTSAADFIMPFPTTAKASA